MRKLLTTNYVRTLFTPLNTKSTNKWCSNRKKIKRVPVLPKPCFIYQAWERTSLVAATAVSHWGMWRTLTLWQYIESLIKTLFLLRQAGRSGLISHQCPISVKLEAAEGGGITSSLTFSQSPPRTASYGSEKANEEWCAALTGRHCKRQTDYCLYHLTTDHDSLLVFWKSCCYCIP